MLVRGVFGVGTLVVALLLTLGHVCVLPLDMHVEANDVDHQDSDAFHAASCEALPRVAANAMTVTAVRARIPIVVAPSGLKSQRLTGAVAIVRESPPLFVLHGALLI